MEGVNSGMGYLESVSEEATLELGLD